MSVLASRLTDERLSLLEPGAWQPFPPLRDRTAWSAIRSPTRDHLLSQAEAVLATGWPLLTATGYRRFWLTGDRQGYEGPYFARRTRLAAALVAAALAGPDERLLGEITDGIWLLCEETTWCVPAHLPEPLPDPARPHIDLFAADTAALLAYASVLAGDLLDEVTRARLADEVRRRVLRPYRERDDWWWFGLTRTGLNNWTTWIASNVLPASLLLDERREDAVSTARRTVAALDRYLASVPADGGCDEGIAYWWKAGGCLFECLRTLESVCGQDTGVFEIPMIRAIARYPVVAHIAGDWHVNFADGPAKITESAPHLLYRFGRATGDEEITRHARALRGPDGPAASLVPAPNGSLHHVLAAALDTEWADEPPRDFPSPAASWLPETQVLTAREPGGLFLAAKGGHNDESHNHNDVGSFIVAAGGRPALIDVGVGVYTRQTFGPDRYDIWTMRSSWHNLPEVDDVPQRAGREHAARDVSATLTAEAAELSMDLAAAYPAESGIRSWRRTLRLDRAARTVTVRDTWEISHCPERLVQHLIAARAPVARPGCLVIPGQLLIRYCPGDFDARITERGIDDPRLHAVWGRSVYRITLTATRPASRGSCEISLARDG